MVNGEQSEIGFRGGNLDDTDYAARRFRLLIENSTDIIVTVSPRWNYRQSNKGLKPLVLS